MSDPDCPLIAPQKLLITKAEGFYWKT